VVLLESVDEFVVRRRLSVNVVGRAEIVKDLVERPESCVVSPAVDIGGLDVEDLFPESFGDKLRDAGLASAAGSSDDGRVGRFPVCDWFEDAGEVVELGVAMLDFARDEPGAEEASIADHLMIHIVLENFTFLRHLDELSNIQHHYSHRTNEEGEPLTEFETLDLHNGGLLSLNTVINDVQKLGR